MKRIVLGLVIFTFILTSAWVSLAANSQTSRTYREEATIDSAPGASGYWTKAFNIMQRSREGEAFFAITGASWSATVTLQFKHKEDAAWTDFSTYSTNGRYHIYDTEPKVYWRAGVDNGEYSNGTVNVAIGWR